MTPSSAMILAAGKGERMRPLTSTCPKPLIEVAGKTMLARAYKHVQNAHIFNCVVNAHYLGSQIESAAQGFAKISHEVELLDTAGGVLKALPLLESDPIFVLNGDVVWIDATSSYLQKMSLAWTTEMKSLLMLVPKNEAYGYEGRGDFFLDEAGRLRRPQVGEDAPYIYGGVQIISKSAFEGYAIAPFSFNKIWNQLMEKGQLYGAPFEGPWFHIGTPEALDSYEPIIRQLEEDLQRQRAHG
ncbi:Nucleotidyltransferase family protein [Candidatus Bealeia paramacronuclearis]|uniref:Nucleotidyltransferase family protein n=1 Tax=Candidatus Bealeia paramacronuclearis TaxID=1921001 RepID=A0ABZ2C3L1_9PROT|nr:Nucleotidyltransferase family protein [Candidatus Bealeia paramacronuclearis]